jgi:hypothetical protein
MGSIPSANKVINNYIEVVLQMAVYIPVAYTWLYTASSVSY